MSRYAGISGASRYSKGTLDKVYKRGLGAYYSSGSRPKVSAHQWAMGSIMPLTRKQKKIARVAEPRNKITAADFKKLRNSTTAKKVMKKKRGKA
jgi:hypothetical protein